MFSTDRKKLKVSYSIVAGVIRAIPGLIISVVVIEIIGLPDKITKLTFPWDEDDA